MKHQTIPTFMSTIDLYAAFGAPAGFTAAAEDFSFFNVYEPSAPGHAISPPAHRAGFYSFIFVKDASGRYLQNQHNRDVAPGTIYFGNPGDVIQFHFKEVKALYLLTLTESFLVENTHPGIMQEFPFLQSEALPPLQLNSEQMPEFEQLYEQIKKVYQSHSPLFKKQIGYLLLLMLLKIKEKSPQDHKLLSKQDRQSTIVNSFKLLLRRHYHDLYNSRIERAYNAKDYAAALGVHPNHLNHVLKEKTGKPVSKWIIDKTISESKLLLAHSGLSIKEIAYRLGFQEASYFCRYFKKYTKLTAAAYRKNNHAHTPTCMLHPILSTQGFTA